MSHAFAADESACRPWRFGTANCDGGARGVRPACGSGGCTSSGLQSPKTRIGALPFPGISSLYAAADPAGVTPHRYEGGLQTVFAAEGDRGIIYTTRAGFIDMAHLRESMDWTWYLARLIEASPEEQGVRVVRFSHECVDGELRVPAGLDEAQRAYVAGLAAYRLLTWHEVSTWYGYSLVPLVSEKRSTFTVDDTTSHVVGVGLGRTLAVAAHSREEYDAAAGDALEALMARIGALGPSETTRMCDRVKGSWWQGSSAILLDAHTALRDGAKRPLLAMEDGGVELGPALDGLAPVVGMPPLGSWWSFAVSGAAGREVERVLGQSRVDGDDDLVRLIEDVAEHAAKEGMRVVCDVDVTGPGDVELSRHGD